MARAKSASGGKESRAIYFRYDHAGDSFSGTLEDECSFTDEQIKEYIQYANPALYKQLHGLPLGSSDILHGLETQTQFEKVHNLNHGSYPKIEPQQCQQIPEDHAYETLESVPQDAAHAGAHLNISMLELQLKRQVQINLLNGYSFILRTLQAQSDPQLCSSPTCLTDGLVFYDTFYLTLKQDIFPNGYTGLHEITNQTHYCLECLENIFDGKQIDTDALNGKDEKAAVDGVGRDQVMRAAARLYNTNTAKFTQDVSSNDELSPTSISTSSHGRAYDIRLKKQQDIEATVNEVNRYEKQRSLSDSSENVIESSPNLLSSRPFYMEAQKERYRKQGWRPWDKKLALRKEDAENQPNKISPTSQVFDTSSDAQCYCREPDTGMEDMIKCSHENCSIGWFHLRCTGLQDNPPEDGRFVCEYCKNDYGPFKPVLTDEEMEDETAANDLILDQADRYVDREDESAHDWDEDEEFEGNDTMMSTVTQWGTPINVTRRNNDAASPSKYHERPSNPHISEADQATNTSYATDDNQAQHLDGLTMTERTSTPIASVSPASLNGPVGPTSLLFPGSSQTRFSDLAPFITTDGLSAAENKVFDHWRSNLPPSRLICVMLGDEGVYNGKTFGCESGCNGGADDPVRLSELLITLSEGSS